MDIPDYVVIVGLIGLLGLGGYGLYRAGVNKERRDYTAAYVEQVKAAYWDGFWDGYASHRDGSRNANKERVVP